MAPKKPKMPSAPEPSGKEKEGKDKAKTLTPPAEVKTPDRPPGYIEMKPFQRLPKEILHNHCQKHKMPKPQYEQRRAPKGFFKTECILSNPKDSSKTMRFLTNEEFPFKSHSENFSALLALFHLEPSRPYEKLFPSPFREAWLSLSGELPQQQQQEPAVATVGGSKKPSAKARQAKGTANAQPVAKITAARAIGAAAEATAESGNNNGAATGAAQATAADGLAGGPEAGSPVASVQNEGGATRGPRSGPEGPVTASEASPVGGSVGTTGALNCIQITSAHRYASEFERQQAAETKRLERVKREKEKEMQRLEEEAQMPTVFMAELVRRKTAQILRELLPHVAATRCEPAAVASAAAAVAAAVSASASSKSGAVSARKANEDSFLLPLQWTDTKWTAAVTWALRRQLNPQRALGSLRTKLLKELTEHLQFEKNSAVIAVEAALAVLLSGPPQQPQQQQEQTESSAMQQLLESCEDFIALNTTDESLLPPHFSPAGKQIEIRCQTASSQGQEKDQQEQQQKQQLDDKKEKAAMQAAKERLAAALKKYTEADSEEPLRGTLSHLEGALNSLCCSTGLHAIAAGVLEGQLKQQQQQQKQQGPQQAAAGPAAVLSDAFAAVAAAAAAVVGSSEESNRRELLQRLGASQLLADVAVLPITDAVKEQELEAAESLLPNCVVVRLCVPIEYAAPSGTSSRAATGFYLQIPLDASAASSLESCLKASLGSLYPLEPPVVWISSGGAMGSDTREDQIPPFGEGVGAILCGAFAAHNALRLSRPLQQLSEYISSQAAPNADSNVSKSSCAPQLLSVLSSPACETSISDVTGLLLASWQMEAQLDELLSNDPEGPRGMFARWVAISTGAVKLASAPPARSVPPRRGANAAAEKNSVEENAAEKNAAEQQKMQQYDAGSESRTSRAPGGGPTEARGKTGDGNVGAHSAGPLMSSSRHSTLSRTGGRLAGGEAEVCKTIIDGVKTAASAEALGLPVRQHFDSVMEFMANPRKRVLVVQGETGSGKTTQLPRMLLEAAAHLALQQQNNEGNIMGSDKEHFPAYIVCTQPRRLAAVSVASRVATEMGASVGGLVGYQVRLESRVTKHTRLLFCTHGVLLRQLLSSDALDKFSVVVVDEVHERCTEVDMLLLVLAKALASNKHNLKVVVMSASLAVEHFASYFLPERLTTLRGSCSTGGITQPQEHCQRQNRRLRAEMDRSDSSVDVLKVPGKTFPVSVHYLDEVLRMCDPSSLPAAYQSAPAIAAAVEARHKGGRPTAAKTEWREQQQDTFSPTPTTAENAAATAAGTSVGSLPQLPQLVAAVVRHVHLTGTPCPKSSAEGTRGSRRGKHGQQHQQQATGTAIIVFCSGVGEVSAVCRAIEELQMDLWVLPCHASLHPKQQQKVFAAPPSGWRKVVVATNIAETSITISDVGYVIDCGTHKVLRYDPSKRSSRLQEELITKANAQQRRGRAGRVSEGCCLRLYQKDEFANMATVETPELHRQALDNVCLQLKAIFPKEPLHSLFRQCLDPPAQEHIDASIRHLEHLGALECVGHDLGESLTPLGLYLSRFPMSISFAKMLIFAAPLGCLEETLALCSLMAADSELYLPGAEAAAERQKYFARSQSDFVSSLRVFAGWESAVSSGRSAEDSFCLRFGVNASTCRAAEALRKRFRRVAREAGLMVMMPPDTDSQAQPKARGGKRGSPATTASPSRSGSSSNAGDCASDSGEEDVTLRVEEVSPVASRGPVSVDSKTKSKDSVRSIYWYIKACVVAGLYPQVATIQAPRTYTTVGSGTLEKAPEAWQMKFFTRVDADPNSPQEDKKSPRQKLQRVFIHPTSVNFKSCDFDTQWVAFSEKLQTTKVFIKDVSTVSVFALLLLSCCELVPAQGEGALWLDGWLQLRCPGLICSYVKHLKGLFHAFLNEFYSLSAFGLTGKSPQGANQQVQQEALDYDAIAIEQEAAAPNKAKFAFFGARAAQQRRLDLTALVKRLVELEGHLI